MKTTKLQTQSRRRFLYALGAISGLGFIGGLAGCKDKKPEQPQAGKAVDLTGLVVEVHRSATCGCCKLYEQYLREAGITVQSYETDQVNALKNQLGLPENLWSCHTAKIKDYFVEGHVPLEAIRMLLEQQPAIDGIALPGMPLGSPGMSGSKREPFVIYAIAQGQASEFVKI